VNAPYDQHAPQHAPQYVPAPPVKRKRFGFVALGSAALLAFLAGLGIGNSGDTTPPAPAPAASDYSVSVPTYAPPAVLDDEVVAPPVTVTPFGQSFTYVDGLSVTVSEAKVYQPRRGAAGHVNPIAVRLTITVQNSGSQPFDPNMFGASASFAGQSGERIFDSANGILSPPSTTLLPGKSISFPVAFSIVEGSGELQVDLAPSWGHVSATFTGPVS
jgi:hypothetical protein